jgi:ribosomal protein S18 acetylase RimI-like enzyme
MKATVRKYQTEDDYWRIRAFLREVFLLNERRELSWHVSRLDYWRWHVIENCSSCDPLEDVTFIWETGDGRIVAVLNPEEPGQAFLQVHPGFRAPELEEEMVSLAEENLAVRRGDQQVLCVWVNPTDSLRMDILERSGYTKGKWTERQWRRDLHAHIPEVKIAGWEWYLNIQRCPLYRRDLDIVAVASGGEIASFCTIWYDDVTRSAYVEPVATVPEHQRRGLARAVISEGLRRLQRLGATRAFVGGLEPAPNALYASVMSPEHDLCEQWVKKW